MVLREYNQKKQRKKKKNGERANERRQLKENETANKLKLYCFVNMWLCILRYRIVFGWIGILVGWRCNVGPATLSDFFVCLLRLFFMDFYVCRVSLDVYAPMASEMEAKSFRWMKLIRNGRCGVFLMAFACFFFFFICDLFGSRAHFYGWANYFWISFDRSLIKSEMN